MIASKTLVLMSDTRVPSADISKYYNLAAYGNYMYAKELGYAFKYLVPYGESEDCVCKNPITGDCRHPSWTKILSIYRELPQYDTVIYIDSDAYFNNKESVYSRSNHQNVPTPIKFLTDIPWSTKPNGGFIMVDNTEKAKDFLSSWFRAEGFNSLYDREKTWEQAYLQTVASEYLTVLDCHQIKIYKDTEDFAHNRKIINHVSGNVSPDQYQIMYPDIERIYGLRWFPEVLTYIEKSYEKYYTADVLI